MSVLPKISFPVSSNGQGKEFNNQEELLAHLDGENSGPYLVGTQGMWHGGIHITNLTTPWCVLSGSNASELQYVAGKPFGGEQPVKCMADGEIVAYRVCEDYESVNWRGNPLFFSDSFVLVKHYVQPGETKASGLTFYTLYMNMAPFSAYRQDNADERETASALSYYASAEDVKSGKKAGSLPAGSRLTLGNGVISAPRDLQNRQYSEVTLVKAAKDTELVTGTTVWVVSDRNNLKLTSGAADLPSWWANCSPAYNPSGTSLARYRTAKNWRYYLSSDDVLANRSAGTLTAGFPVSADLSNKALRVVRSSDSHTFSLVTLGQAVGKEIKGNRVWVVSDADSLIPENDTASGDQPEFGKVVNLSTPVKIQAGDSIGHLGFFELPTDTGRLSRYQVHIECLSMDENLERFLTNPERAGEEDPVCVKYEKDAPLMMPDEKGAMVDVQRKTKAPGLLTLSQVSTVDEDGHSTADKKRAAYYEVEPEGGWLAAEHVQKMSRYALAALGFTTLKSTSENFDLIDGIHHPADVVKGILEQLYAAAKEDPRSSYALNAYNYRQLLEQADSNHDGYYSEKEYVQAIHNASYRDRLFRLIVKHPGEWYYGREDAPWKNYLDSLGKDVQEWRDYTEAFLDKIIWMKQVPGMIAEPWHMHPVMFLGVLKPRAEKQVIFPLKVKPKNDVNGTWPNYYWAAALKDINASQAIFGRDRGGGSRKHAARDLYTEPLTEVVAICDGIVEFISSYYYGTWQITIKHATVDGRQFYIRYGEVDFDSIIVEVGQEIKQGELIAKTGLLINPSTSKHPSIIYGETVYMLHFEYYINANDAVPPYDRRRDLRDPLNILKEGYQNTFNKESDNLGERIDVSLLTLSDEGRVFIKGWEDFQATAYNDSQGYCTIGYGHLIARSKCEDIVLPEEFQRGITRERAEELFDLRLPFYIDGVRKAVTVKLYQHEFDALVSLLFGLGGDGLTKKAPMLRKRLNDEDYTGAAQEFLDITNGGQAGLVKRRQAERNLFCNNQYDSSH
ncbi:peptidoglycan DD-metalloendopeptidase family protein [Cronobacter dublinensis]|uniref:glycoside hydrolase family protein n=1 Tax=Cronobacter dublinensis TaxID=413497 RepID=UPI0029307940|nr:peptidoglycan DD-metalloendopeptidase family protein [Cronobacter dublinensis]WNY84612.1 peptidoglycan DD-metalloendopeptidase family protein [Cronobacter dublinensis]